MLRGAGPCGDVQSGGRSKASPLAVEGSRPLVRLAEAHCRPRWGLPGSAGLLHGCASRPLWLPVRPGQAPGHEGDENPADVGFRVGDGAFVVAGVAAGSHGPGVRAFHHPSLGQEDESFGAFGFGDGFEGDTEDVPGPVDELAGVGGVAPGQGDLGVGLVESGQEDLAADGVVGLGGGDDDVDQEAVRINGEMPFRPLIKWARAELVETPPRCRLSASARRPPLIRALSPQRQLTCVGARGRHRERSLGHR